MYFLIAALILYDFVHVSWDYCTYVFTNESCYALCTIVLEPPCLY
ncbi:hypothetical protein TorRG33x02_350350 [Trema orientale]|uniref:Uncharacterized protein n=1 Tax=Trema orientale TaxID=63057 RepID=A0A2P5AHC7_TREOI|nr:hypothetical protein TorRG33x02_350350 [Trema orientale]